jgi:hypothetical protein
MAIIYDLATGTVISEHEGVSRVTGHAREEHCTPALQAVNDTFDPEQASPTEAYMVLLQRLLKDL